MDNCIGSDLPATASVKLSNDGESDPLPNNTTYRKLVGSLMYLSTRTRPDIAYITFKLAQFVEKPLYSHWKALMRVLKYLKSTQTFGIIYSKTQIKNLLFSYSDSDFAGDISDRKSTTGSVILLNSGSIVWTSHRQKCVATSTTEAEYIACSVCIKDTIWVNRFLNEIGIKQAKSPVVLCDNQPAVRMIHSNEILRRTRHIEVSLYFVREKVKNKEVNVEHIGSPNQVADILTKPLPLQTFLKHRTTLGIYDISNN